MYEEEGIFITDQQLGIHLSLWTLIINLIASCLKVALTLLVDILVII